MGMHEDPRCQDCNIPFEAIPKSLHYASVPNKGHLCIDCWNKWRKEDK